MPTTPQPAQPVRRSSVFGWAIPVAIVVLLVAGAIGTLANGWVPADLIGADGLAATTTR